jgi:dihydrofolate reductase
LQDIEILLENKVLELKQSRNGGSKDILVGSRSLIIQLINLNLVDEFQICIHPIIEGKGLLLFDQIKNRILLKLIKAKTLNFGATVFYYQPISDKKQ